MTEHHPTYFEARNVYQRLADMLPLVQKLSFLAEHGEVVNLGRVVRDALGEMFRLQKAIEWKSIDTAPHDRDILVWAVEPARHNVVDPMPPFVTIARWHPDAGFCVCEVREPTHWRELPEPPK